MYKLQRFEKQSLKQLMWFQTFLKYICAAQRHQHNNSTSENIFHQNTFLLWNSLYLIITYCDPIRQPIHYTNVTILDSHWLVSPPALKHCTIIGQIFLHYIICRSQAPCQNPQDPGFTNICIPAFRRQQLQKLSLWTEIGKIIIIL